jgi:23S rRNA (adenine2503-C2)-methyltransferase
MGFARQLTADEIYEQAALAAASLRRKGERLSHVVMMGQGEPLANYRNVLAAVRRMHDELGISYRRITISTVGLAPNILKLADEGLPITLAVSLHQTTDAARSELMPVNRRFPIASVLDAANSYHDRTGRRISFEWALIAGENDNKRTARELGKLLVAAGLKGKCHVNVIPLNPTAGFDGAATRKADVGVFCTTLEEEFRVPATPRMRRGQEIDAGCGQLTTEIARERREEEMVDGAEKTFEAAVGSAGTPSGSL